jgi:branched-chain amino acid transport system ATP-binding protein
VPDQAARPPALAVDDLHAGHGPFEVIRGLSLHVEPGALVGLVGRNGVGKTTTLRAISGLVRPRAGTVALHGQALSRRPEDAARQGLAHVPEGRRLMPDMSVLDNLRLAVVAVGHRWRERTLHDILADFPEIEPLLDRRAGLLSGGEQQLAALARGLIAQPKVIMIDELSLGLAPVAVQRVFGALDTAVHRHGIAALIVDQDIHRLMDLCDRAYLLRDGQAIAWDPADVDGVAAAAALG